MPADSMKTGSSASTIWRVAINAPERRLLVAAGTEMEMNDWVDKLVMAFRINSGQPPLQRASMPASSLMMNTSGSSSLTIGHSVNSNPNIRDFQNFSVPRRGMNQRHSTGGHGEMRVSMAHQGIYDGQIESMKKQELEEQDQVEEEEEKRLAGELRHEQQLWKDQEERHVAEQEAEMRRQLAAQQQKEQEEERAMRERQEAAAFAAAEKLQREEEQEKMAQMKRKLQHEKDIKMQQAVALQRAREEEAARIQHEQEQEMIRAKQLADEMAMQQTLQLQSGGDMLELQRHQKREKHARQRMERKEAIKLKLQQEKEEEDIAFRMTPHDVSRLNVDDKLDNNDNEPERSSMPRVSGGGLPIEDAVHPAPSTTPRSSLVGNVKREMIQKQQIERQRRREAALQRQQHQQTRGVEKRQQHVEMEQQCAKMETLHVHEAFHEVEVAPREIEVVRRAPVKKPAPATAPMESFEF
ncbi:unnamed protein product [Peronospora belbahrii]|uniref:PH domain-containing protein n=1 Tax=Peronospora belbahrii TaxID=622444 RepID=A0AAU9KX16_9STRA|nr:unnamed protein product [Peronospora belbahrii]